MAAYLIAHVNVRDPDGYKAYVAQVPATIHQYGGRYIARGGKVENIEGDWPINRLVIVEFPSLEAAHAWYDSPEYAPVKVIRQQTADAQIIFVEGLA